MDTKNDFSKGSVAKNIWSLAVPMTVAQLVNVLYSVVDRIYIGHIPNVGVSALAGVGVCMPLIMLVSAFAALVGYGGLRGCRFIWERKTMKQPKRYWETVLQCR